MRWLGCALLLGLAVLALLYPWRDRLLGPFIIRELQRVAAEDHGLVLHIGATGGSWLSDFELHDVVVEPAPELGLERATVVRLSVQYSLPGLLAGRMEALRGAQLTGADVALDLDRIDQGPDDGSWSALELLPEVRLEDARLQLTLEGDSLEVAGLNARFPAGVLAASGAPPAELVAGATALRVVFPALAVEAAPPAAAPGPGRELLLDLPSWHAEFRRDADRLELLQLTSEGRVLVERAALGLEAALDGRIELEAETPLAAGRARLRYDTGDETDRLGIGLQDAEVPALRLLALQLGWPMPGQLPESGLLDLEAALDVRWDPAFDATGQLGLRARQLGWRAADVPGDTPRGPGDVLSEAFDRVSLDVTLERDSLTLDRGELAGPEASVDLAGTRMAWLSEPTLELVATAQLAGTEFPAGWPVTVEAQAALGDDGVLRVPELTASGAGARLRLDDLQLDVSQRDAHSSFGLATLEFADDTAELEELEVRWDEAAQVLTAELRDVRLALRGQLLALVAPARLTYSRRRLLAVESFKLEGAGGEVSLSGHFDVRDAEADLEFTARNLHPTGLLRAFVPDFPEYRLLERLEVGVRGPPDALVTSASLRLLGVGGLAPLPLNVELEAQHQADSLTIDNLRISAEDLILATGSFGIGLRDGRLDAQAGALQGELSFALEDALALLDDVPLRAIRLGGSLSLAGNWPEPELEFAVEGLGLQFPGVDLPEGARWPDLDARLLLSQGSLALEQLTLDAGGIAQLKASGSCAKVIQLGSDADGWPTLSVDLAAPVQAEVDVSGAESAWLVTALPGVRRAAGHVEAHLLLDGSLRSPRLAGPLQLTNGELALEGQGLASLTELQGSARFDAPLELVGDPGAQVDGDAQPSGVALRDIQFEGELGAAPFQLTGELMLLPPVAGSALPSLQADLTLDGEELLLYRSGGVKLRANTHLQLHGPWETMQLTGAVAITDGRATRHMSLLDLGGAEAPIAVRLDRFAATRPPWNALRLDVKLTTVTPMRISNRLIRSNVRLDARLMGKGGAPQLSGNIIAERSQIEVPLWTFTSDRAAVHFDPRNLMRSELSGTARSRMLGYDVLAVLSGPLEGPEVRLSSLPPLGEEELVNLVLTGQLPQERTFAEDSRVLSGVAIYLGKDLLQRAFGDESTESNESLMSRFEVETGRNQSRTGTESLDVRFRMMDDVFTEDDSLYLEVEKSEFDETNGSLRLVFRLK